MSKQENSLGLGEISTIRDILVGKQISEFQEQFIEVKNRMDAMQQSMDERMKQMEEERNRQLTTIKEEMSTRINTLIQNMNDKNVALDNQIQSTNQDNQELIGSLLKSMGEKLLNNNK